MLAIKIHERISGKIHDYLESNQLTYTKNGNEFEVSLSEKDLFNFGRYYQQTLTNYYNEIQLQEKEEQRKDTTGLRP